MLTSKPLSFLPLSRCGNWGDPEYPSSHVECAVAPEPLCPHSPLGLGRRGQACAHLDNYQARASAFWCFLDLPGGEGGGRLACLGDLEVGLDSSRDTRTQPSAQDKERLPNVGKKIHNNE